MTHHRITWIALAVTTAVCLTSPGRAATSPAAAGADPAVVTNAARLIQTCLIGLYEKSSAADTQYFDKGQWVFPNSAKEGANQAGAGTAAAVLWHWMGVRGLETLDPATPTYNRSWLRLVAIETFDRLIQDNQTPAGSFGDAGLPGTQFFGVELGTAYDALKDTLDKATRARWRKTLAAEADYMVKHGDTKWYTNGNINLMGAELFYLTWLATQDATYKETFETYLAFTLNPPQTGRWKGFGLACVKQPTREDGADGMGYLAEKGAGDPGFDPAYLQLQMDIASRLYIVSRDARILRLLNLFANMELPRVDQRTWLLDAMGGSRQNVCVPLTTPGLAVAGWLADREDLAVLVPSQAPVIAACALSASQQNRHFNLPAFYRSMGNELAVILQADMLATEMGRTPRVRVAPVTAAEHGTRQLDLPNPGFEDGLKGWVNSKNSKAGPMSQVLPEAAHTGHMGLRIIDTNSVSDGSMLESKRLDAQAGKTYELTFWARRISGTSIGVYLLFSDVAMQRIEPPAGTTTVVSIPFAPGGDAVEKPEWQAYSLSCVAPTNTCSLNLWIHSGNTAVATVDFDDFVLREKETPAP